MRARAWARGAVGAVLLSSLVSACATTAERPAAPPAEAPPPVAAPPPVDPNVRLVQGRAETVTTSRYSAERGVLLEIARTTISPARPAPGQSVTLGATILALAPDEKTALPVRETWAVLFGGVSLLTLPPRELTLPQGTSEVERTIHLPADAADGEYTVEVTLQPVTPPDAAPARLGAPFTVAAPARPPEPKAPSPRESPAPETRTGAVKVESVDVRTGPGASFRPRARIPRATLVEILEERGVGRERWYRIRLVNGDEGWVPATAVGGESR
jgi:hypothetical protein